MLQLTRYILNQLCKVYKTNTLVYTNNLDYSDARKRKRYEYGI